MGKSFGIAFEKVGDKFRVHKSEKPTVDRDDKIEIDGKKYYVSDIKLPVRADKRSAGYDFFLASDVEILPAQKTIIFTDVKAKMPDDVVLELYIRSSLAVKQGLMLSNSVGIIDASYYSNPDNDGNIGIALPTVEKQFTVSPNLILRICDLGDPTIYYHFLNNKSQIREINNV